MSAVGRELHVQVQSSDDDVTAVALVLHGGRATSTEPTRERQLAVLRLRPVAAHLGRTGAAHGLAVARLRYTVRGWNGAERSPVADTRWALDQLHSRFPGRPVALIGHSMGGRVVNYVADDPAVTTAVELAPWVEPGDPTDTMTARSLLVVHGSLDKMTSPRRSAEYAQAVHERASDVHYVGLRNTAHAIIGRAALANELTSGYVLWRMYELAPRGPLAKVLAESRLSTTI